jgi:tetratricopeptide (TPR) repeat protein
MNRILQSLCLAAGIGALPVCALYAQWHAPQAEFRRELKVEGEGGAALCATTTVFLDDRHGGLALFDAQGRPRAFQLLNRVGSQVALFFDALPGETLYLYPLPEAELPPPGGGAPPSAGLRHEARAYDGREVQSLAQFRELWNGAAFQGARFTDRVYDSCNPFGPNAGALHRYDGTLLIETPGVTAFCTASTDASFLLINDTEVAAWPGRHGIQEGLDGSRRGSLTLQQGLYRFTYLHANSADASFAIAAMVPPGEKRHFVIEPQMFTRARYAFVGALTGRDGRRRADFIWENRYMVTIHDHVAHELVFEASAADGAEDGDYQWEFADGSRARGRRIEHLLFSRGDFTVRLRVGRGDSQSVCLQTVLVQPRYGQSENDDARALALLEAAVRQERERGVQPRGYGWISRGWFFFLREQEAAAFAPRVLAAADRIPAEHLNAVMIELALGVQQVGEQYELAERCFKVIIEKCADPRARAFAALHCSGMLNLCLNRPEEAREMQRAIRREDLGPGEQRLLEIYLADTAMVLDDFAAARRMYLAIEKPRAPISGDTLNREVIFDYNSRYFRLQNLLSQGLYRESLEALDMIEWEMPEERAAPRMNLLKVQALLGNGQPQKAVVCLQRALLAEADDTYTPRLRLELARLYAQMRRFAQAQHQINLIRRESPWSREELEARRLAQTIEEQIAAERVTEVNHE